MIKTEKSDQFLRTKQSTDVSPKMTKVLELSDNDFKTATTTMFRSHTVKINTTEIKKKKTKIVIVSRKIEMFNKKNQVEILDLKNMK